MPTGNSTRYAYHFADAVWTGRITLGSTPHVRIVYKVYILAKQGLHRFTCHTVVLQHDGLKFSQSILSSFLKSKYVHQCLAGVSCMH